MRLIRLVGLGIILFAIPLIFLRIIAYAQSPPVANLVSDSFSRTVSSGWGTSDTGQAYIGTGSSDFNVDGSQGTINTSTSGIQKQAVLSNTLVRDSDVKLKVKTDKLASGSDINLVLMQRYQNSTDHYRARLGLTTNGAVTLRAQKFIDATNATIDLGSSSVTVDGLNHTVSSFIWLRSQVTGINPTTINMKAWADGSVEPTSWQATFTDSEPALQATGSVGLLARLNATSTVFPVLFTFDDLAVSDVLLGDANGDGFINATDITLALSEFSQSTCGRSADFDGNCKVNMIDVAHILARMPGVGYPTPTPTVSTDAVITIDKLQIAATSQFSPGFTHVDDSLDFNSSNNSTAVTAARNLVKNSTLFENSHIMAWGVRDSWPDPTTPEPTLWADMDARINLANALGATPIITLCEAPWWMKGQLQSGGTTELIPTALGEWGEHTYTASITDFRGITYAAASDYVSPDPYASRILDNQMPKWLHLVQRVAERYMAPPYNVRYFQVWNELKGYYNPITNKYDFTTGVGDPSGYNAKHGYTYMYNQTYDKVRQVASSLGVPQANVFIGGPYPVVATWSDRSAGGSPSTEPLLQNKPYGYFDQRPLDAIKYWFQNKSGAQFVAIDMRNKNKPLSGSSEPSMIVDPFTANDTFPDVINWIRSLDNSTFPGAGTLPIYFAEWYSNPYLTTDRNYNNSVKADALIKIIKAGGRSALLWGGQEDSKWNVNQSLFSPTNVSGGGQALPWYYSLKAIKDYFGPGTQIYSSSSTSSDIAVMAGPTKTMLVNTTSSGKTVSLQGLVITLAGYEVKVINTP